MAISIVAAILCVLISQAEAASTELATGAISCPIRACDCPSVVGWQVAAAISGSIVGLMMMSIAWKICALLCPKKKQLELIYSRAAEEGLAECQKQIDELTVEVQANTRIMKGLEFLLDETTSPAATISAPEAIADGDTIDTASDHRGDE